MYKMDAKKYHKLMFENTIDTINSEAETMLSINKIKGKIRKMNTNNAFITVKAHKNNFPCSVKYRLLNPCKSGIGKISKNILDRIIPEIRIKINYNNGKTPKRS